MYECIELAKSGNIVVITKNTCYFTLHRIWNIDLHNTENSIFGPLDFKTFQGGHTPRTPQEARAFSARI